MKATQAVCEWPGCKTPPAEGAPVCGQHRLWAIGIVAKSPIVDQVEAIKRLEGDTLRWLGDTLRLSARHQRGRRRQAAHERPAPRPRAARRQHPGV
jgi:hypothetical protein